MKKGRDDYDGSINDETLLLVPLEAAGIDDVNVVICQLNYK